MKLYTRAQNSAGERVRIALHLKGLAYEYVSLATLTPEAYARINPQGLMPTLEVDGNFIPQSAAILAFLEEACPTPALLPEDPVLRAEARAFGAFIAAEMHALSVNRVRRYIARDLNLGEDGAAGWTQHWLSQGYKALEAMLDARDREWPFCYGETPGWADLHLIPQLANARRLGVDISSYRRLLAVEARCTPLDAFRRARPEAQPDWSL